MRPPSTSALIGVAEICAFFAAAWAASRVSGRVAEAIMRRHDRRGAAADMDTGTMASLKRRETAVSLIRTSLRYAVFGLALVMSLGVVSGTGRLTAVAGASLFVVLIGFAAQRFLTDILAGFFMFFEGWFSVGDTVTLEPSKLQGVVDEMGLRSTRLRAVTGELVRIHNSQIQAVRVLPSTAREVAVEIFCQDEEDARGLVEAVAELVPAGPTRFVTRPWVSEVEPLGDDLVRIEARAAVAHGREWLAEDLLPKLLSERAPDGLIVHGPVVLHGDDMAAKRFSRATARARAGR
jgi:moderate conductance mechanosensitive channel